MTSIGFRKSKSAYYFIVFTMLMIVPCWCKSVISVSIFGPDHRVVQHRDDGDRSYAVIGPLHNDTYVPGFIDGKWQGEKAFGTATIISPCLVLAATHVVFGAYRVDRSDFTETLYTFNGAGQKYNKTTAHPVHWGHLGSDVGPYLENEDWVILKLDDCVGERIGWARFASIKEDQSMFDKHYEMPGFPEDKSRGSLWNDPDCHIYANEEHLLYHDCASVGGSSGSPIIFRGQDGVLEIAGMHIAGQKLYPGQVNWAFDTSNLAIDCREYLDSEEVRSLVEHDIARFGRPNPASRE